MMQDVAAELTVPMEGMDWSTAFEDLKQTKAIFIKNWTDEVNNGVIAQGANGQNRIKFTPVGSNYEVGKPALDAILNVIERPEADFAGIGYFYYQPKNWGFSFVADKTSGQHLIYRIDGNRAGAVELVYQRTFLNFQYNPQHFIGPGRCVCLTTNRYNKELDAQQEITFLVFVDAFNETRFICIEDSIATQGFTMPVEYFQPAAMPFYEEGYINLGVPPPMQAMSITPIARFTADMTEAQRTAEKNKANRMSFTGFQWRCRFIDIWGRPSEYGMISDLYVTNTSLYTGANTAPRGVKLRFEVGTPLISKVELLVRNTNGIAKGMATSTDWYLYDTIDKYEDTQPWYNRQFREELKYDGATNSVEYAFYNDKVRIPVAVDSTNRLFNPLPLLSGAVTPMDKRIALSRNTRDFEPWDKGALQQVRFGVEKPATNNCNATMRKIKVWGYLWNHSFDKAPALRRDGTSIVFAIADNNSRSNDAYEYKQVLPTDQEGTIAYLVGASGQNYCISKQYKYNFKTGEYPTYIGLDFTNGGEDDPFSVENADYVPLQGWEFTVPPGTYLVRFAAHSASPADDYAKTSARVKGVSKKDNFGTDGIIRETAEWVIDCNGGDVDLFNQDTLFLYNYDFTSDDNTNRRSVCEGYLYEDEISKIPIEAARIENNTGNALRSPNSLTDHNGFYYMSTKDNGLHVTFYGVKNGQINQQLIQSSETHDSAAGLYKFDKLYVYQKETPYPVGDRFYIHGRVVLSSDNSVGVAGALVWYEHGSYAFTDADGNYTIIAHEDGGGENKRAADQVMLGQRGNYLLLRPDLFCFYSFIARLVFVPALTTGSTNTRRETTVGLWQVAVTSNYKRGPHMGGRYGMGLILHDWMDRQSFVQAIDQHIIDIPSLQETGTFDFSRITYDLQGAKFPKWVKAVSFAVTENLIEENYLTWAADRVQYVDNTGVTNNAAPTAIRLYYEGLNEYNKQQHYSTNTSWQFLISSESNASVVTGDQVEFLAKGDGSIFSQRIVALAQYDKEGTYVQIAYNDDLKDLTDNTLVRLIRPKLSNDQPFYYELPPMITVKEGVASVPAGYVPLTDAYLLQRQIPVPMLVVKTKPDTDGKLIQTSETENQLRSYAFPFEHHSPADSWGDHAWNRGRVNVHNDYEKQHILKTEIAVSDTLSVEGSLNYIGFFEDDQRVQFDEQQYDGITAVLNDGSRRLLVICESRNFSLGYRDNRVFADGNGNLQATPSSQLFSAPQPGQGHFYGCRQEDYNTIQQRNGATLWLDTTQCALVRSIGGAATDESDDIRFWLLQKIKGRVGSRYFHGGIDPRRNEYLLTDTWLHPVTFTNDQADKKPEVPETIVYNIATRQYKGMRSFVPELYGAMDGEKSDVQLIAFRYGRPWFHYDINGTRDYCTFFGKVCDRYLKVAFNRDSVNSKTYICLNIYVRGHLLYADEITTEKGQISRLMPKWFELIDKYYSAPFNCATNGVIDPNIIPAGKEENILLDGDLLKGRWLTVRLKTKLQDRNKYGELTAVECLFNGTPKPSAMAGNSM